MTWPLSSLGEKNKISQKSNSQRENYYNLLFTVPHPCPAYSSTCPLSFQSTSEVAPPPLLQGHHLLRSVPSPVLLTRWFSTLPPRGHLAGSGDTLGFYPGRALSMGWRPGVLWSILRCTERPHDEELPNCKCRPNSNSLRFDILSDLGHTPSVSQCLHLCLCMTAAL